MLSVVNTLNEGSELGIMTRKLFKNDNFPWTNNSDRNTGTP